MAQQFGNNMGFGSRFKLNQAYIPSIGDINANLQLPQMAGPNGQPSFGASQGMAQPTPSLMDIGQAQQAQPGGLMGFGNNQDAMMGAGGGGPNYAALAQGLAGMLGKQGGGGEEGGQQVPEPPPSPILQGRPNGKLDELLARYNITL